MVSTAAAHAAGIRTAEDSSDSIANERAILVDFEVDEENRVRLFSPETHEPVSAQSETYTLLPGCPSTQAAVLSPPKARIAVMHNRAVGWTKVEQSVSLP